MTDSSYPEIAPSHGIIIQIPNDHPWQYPEQSIKPLRSPPKLITTPDGIELALVPLYESETPAVIYANDYNRLMKEHVSPNWCLANGYVRASQGLCRMNGTHGTYAMNIARMVLGAEDGERVSYRDGDTLNLRRENLFIV